MVNDRERDGKLIECEERTGIWAWKHPHQDGTLTYTLLQGDVRLTEVDFAYNENKVALRGVSVFAEPGQKVAFVGATGAGKTTIGDAIIYGLFGSVGGKNNGDLISWGEKHGEIEVWCESNGYSLYIKRELNKYGLSPIYAEVNGEELVFTNKRNAQKQLEEEYYDISRITLELLCIISFNNFKSIANLNTGDTKQFLDQVFGFYVLTNYTNICKDIKQDILSFKNKFFAYENSTTPLS